LKLAAIIAVCKPGVHREAEQLGAQLNLAYMHAVRKGLMSVALSFPILSAHLPVVGVRDVPSDQMQMSEACSSNQHDRGRQL
jgi:hypothetical protein